MWAKKNLGRREAAEGVLDHGSCRSVADDGATMLGDHNINAVVTAFKLVGQNLTFENSSSPFQQTRLSAGTACWDASRYEVGAAIAGIDHAPIDVDRRRLWTTNGCGLTTGLGAMVMASFNGRCHRGCNHHDCNASNYESFKFCHASFS